MKRRRRGITSGCERSWWRRRAAGIGLATRDEKKRTLDVCRADPPLWPLADFDVLVQAFKTHGFRLPCAWCLNDDAKIAYAHEAPDRRRISQLVPFVNGDLDAINTINGNRLGDPMRAACADLTTLGLVGAHWLPLERKEELVQAIRTWLQSKKL